MNEWNVVQLNIHISQGSAATEFRCGGRFYFTVFRSLSTNQKVKELLKSVHICQSYRKNKSGTFFYGPRCIAQVHKSHSNLQNGAANALKQIHDVEQISFQVVSKHSLWNAWSEQFNGQTVVQSRGIGVNIGGPDCDTEGLWNIHADVDTFTHVLSLATHRRWTDGQWGKSWFLYHYSWWWYC